MPLFGVGEGFEGAVFGEELSEPSGEDGFVRGREEAEEAGAFEGLGFESGGGIVEVEGLDGGRGNAADGGVGVAGDFDFDEAGGLFEEGAVEGGAVGEVECVGGEEGEVEEEENEEVWAKAWHEWKVEGRGF